MRLPLRRLIKAMRRLFNLSSPSSNTRKVVSPSIRRSKTLNSKALNTQVNNLLSMATILRRDLRSIVSSGHTRMVEVVDMAISLLNTASTVSMAAVVVASLEATSSNPEKSMRSQNPTLMKSVMSTFDSRNNCCR